MSPDQTQHTVLLERIRLGDPKAFSDLYSLYFARVYRFCYKFLKSKEMAQECTQLTFIKIWERRTHLDANLNFKSYLFTITKNCVLKTIEQIAKDNKFVETVQRESTSSVSGDTSDDRELEITAQRILEQLPPQRQLVFRMCKVEGKSYEEVASTLGISSGTVRDHMFKASKAIRNYIALNRTLLLMTAYSFLSL